MIPQTGGKKEEKGDPDKVTTSIRGAIEVFGVSVASIGRLGGNQRRGAQEPEADWVLKISDSGYAHI